MPPNRIIVADSGELVGQYTSLALDANDVPAVSHFSANYLQLLFFRCADASCPTTGNTQRTLDGSGNVGQYSSIVHDAAGNPAISYRDDLSATLKVMRCGDVTCSAGNTVATPDGLGSVGQHTSIALDAAGNPVVSYYSGYLGELKLLVCGNATCTAGNTVTVIDAGTANDGQYTSLALNAAVNPVVSYYSPSFGELKVITCGNATCSSGNTIAIPDRLGDVGAGTSLRMGTDGKPLVAYSDFGAQRLKLLVCGDVTCTRGNTIRQLDTLGTHPSLALDSQGRPVVSYQADGDLKVLRCGDATCSAGNTAAVPDGPGVVGSFTSLKLDSADRPVVSYHDASNGDLKLLLCGTPTCNGAPLSPPAPLPTFTPQPTPAAGQPWITTVDWEGNVGTHTSIRLNAGKPVVAYRDDFYHDLKLLVCGDATCRSGNVIRELDTSENVGQFASVALDSGGAPVVACHDVKNQDLKLVRCSDPTCETLPAITSPDTAGSVGTYASVQVDGAGRPVVAYAASSGATNSLKLLRCGDTTCSAGNTITTVDSSGNVGRYASLALSAAGNPLIA